MAESVAAAATGVKLAGAVAATKAAGAVLSSEGVKIGSVSVGKMVLAVSSPGYFFGVCCVIAVAFTICYVAKQVTESNKQHKNN